VHAQTAQAVGNRGGYDLTIDRFEEKIINPKPFSSNQELTVDRGRQEYERQSVAAGPGFDVMEEFESLRAALEVDLRDDGIGPDEGKNLQSLLIGARTDRFEAVPVQGLHHGPEHLLVLIDNKHKPAARTPIARPLLAGRAVVPVCQMKDATVNLLTQGDRRGIAAVELERTLQSLPSGTVASHPAEFFSPAHVVIDLRQSEQLLRREIQMCIVHAFE